MGVDAEGDDGVGVLVGGEEPVARGVDGEVARGLAPGGFVAEAGEAAGGLVDGKHGDAVVTAVGAVDRLARRRDVDVGEGKRGGLFARLTDAWSETVGVNIDEQARRLGAAA